ncbi:C2H2-type domain-containing protein [Aphelenchoides bicaudatus]|nr:C2H2-type domain-containing protein [Aphelenchoides bicaudatus]
MTEAPKQKKPEIWNPGLDVTQSDVKVHEKDEPKIKAVPPPLMINPIFNYLHMVSMIQQQNQQNGNTKQQLPPFLQLLQANQALNSRGLHPMNASSQKPPTSNRKPNKKGSTVPQPASTTKSNPIVDSVLGNTHGPVNYNSCAICGTSFRLTTDLVGHMRTNHRQSRYKRKLNSTEE